MPDFTISAFKRWRIWHPTAAMFLINGNIFGMWATQIPAFKERLGLDPLMLSLILFMLGGGTVFAMALSAWTIRLVGVLKTIRISTSVYCGLAVLVPLAPGYDTLAAVVLLFGASGGSMNVAMNAIASDVERRSERPFMSSFHGMWSLGGFTGSAAGALLMRVSSPATEAVTISSAMFFLFLCEQRGLFPLTRREPAGHPHARGTMGLTLAGPALMLGVMAIFAFAGEGVVLDWGAVYMKQDLGVGNKIALMGYVAFAGSMAVMRFVGDSIRHTFNARPLVCAGGLIAASGLMIGPLSRDPAIMIAGCAIAGAGLANIVPVLFSLAGGLPRPETQIAAVSTMGFGGLLAVPPLLGVIGQHYGLSSVLYAGAAGDAVIAALALSGLRSSLPSRPAET